MIQQDNKVCLILSQIFLQILNLNINDDDLPGQSYDNGANMRGKNNGLRQKKFLKLIQELFFIPCAAHSLNLVANDAAKLTYETINFFALIQEL